MIIYVFLSSLCFPLVCMCVFILVPSYFDYSSFEKIILVLKRRECEISILVHFQDCFRMNFWIDFSVYAQESYPFISFQRYTIDCCKILSLFPWSFSHAFYFPQIVGNPWLLVYVIFIYEGRFMDNCMKIHHSFKGLF